MDRYLQMQTFVAVVDSGSFVAAADGLGLSKAAVSRHVGELENRLGVRLLQRTTRRLSLTEDGRVFLARSRELLDDLHEAESELSSRGGAAQGDLRINAPVSFGIRHLAPLWGPFQARFPKVRLDVTLADRVVDVVEEGYDLAIRIGTLGDSSLVSKRLATTRIVLCASPEYLRQHGRPEHPGDLARHHTINYSYWSGGGEWRFDGPEGVARVRVRPRLLSNNGETCVAAALQHQGIALQPAFLVGEDIKAGRLVELMPQYRSLVLGVHAVYPSRKHVAPKVRALIDYLAESFDDREWT